MTVRTMIGRQRWLLLAILILALGGVAAAQDHYAVRHGDDPG